MRNSGKSRSRSAADDAVGSAIAAAGVLVLLLFIQLLIRRHQYRPAKLHIEATALPALVAERTVSQARYVASRNGSRYYPRDCGSASRIHEENLISFMTREEAEAMGYSPAQSCRF